MASTSKAPRLKATRGSRVKVSPILETATGLTCTVPVAAEVLVATPAVRNLIREGKIHQIYSLMQTGAKHGMTTMDQSLAALVRTGRISRELAAERCTNEEDLRRLIQSGGF